MFRSIVHGEAYIALDIHYVPRLISDAPSHAEYGGNGTKKIPTATSIDKHMGKQQIALFRNLTKMGRVN